MRTSLEATRVWVAHGYPNLEDYLPLKRKVNIQTSEAAEELGGKPKKAFHVGTPVQSLAKDPSGREVSLNAQSYVLLGK